VMVQSYNNMFERVQGARMPQSVGVASDASTICGPLAAWTTQATPCTYCAGAYCLFASSHSWLLAPALNRTVAAVACTVLSRQSCWCAITLACNTCSGCGVKFWWI
jgi:hypothetical protein